MPKNSTINEHDILRSLDPDHREAMLDLVLAWGSLDGTLSMLLSRTLGVTLDEGADLIAKTPTSVKFAKIHGLLRAAPNGMDAARNIKKYKKIYERYSVIRNRIAHSHCAGVWKNDRDYVVFMTFEKVGVGQLAVDAVPMQEMRRATKWGRAMGGLALEIVDRTND